MYGEDAPYKTKAPAKKGHKHHFHHHLSGWALLIGLVGAPILGIGIATITTNPGWFVVGAIITLFGLIGWVREDYLEFPKGPNPLTHHTQGVKDNGWWGIMLFLATEVVLFGSIFAVWFGSRAKALDAGDHWPLAGTPLEHGLPIVATGINTAILVLSGFVMQWGEKGIITGNRKRFLGGFIVAILLGTVFLAGQVLEYIDLIGEGFVLSTNVYASTFYLLTGTHGFHVLGGLIFLTIVTVRAAKGNFTKERHTAVTAAAYYWHFVDIVWLFLYAVVYLEVI